MSKRSWIHPLLHFRYLTFARYTFYLVTIFVCLWMYTGVYLVTKGETVTSQLESSAVQQDEQDNEPANDIISALNVVENGKKSFAGNAGHSGSDDMDPAPSPTGWVGRRHSPKILAYSALLDTRRVWSNHTAVVVVTLMEAGVDDTQLTWTLHPPHGNTTSLGAAPGVTCFSEASRMCVIPVLSQQTPGAVSCSWRGEQLFHLQVFQPPVPDEKRSLNLCTKPFYTNSSAPAAAASIYASTDYFLAWMELQRLLGVQHVAVYNYSLPAAWTPALELYLTEGFIDLLQTGPTGRDDLPAVQQTAIYQDCVHRHMHSFRWTLVVDFDEVIVPRQDDTIPQMLTKLLNSSVYPESRISDIEFKNAFFFTDNPNPDSARDSAIPLFKYQMRKPYEEETLPTWPKSASNPQLCMMRHAHFCLKPKGLRVGRRGKVIEVDPNIGTVHHYQKCPKPDSRKRKSKRRSPEYCVHYHEEAVVRDTRMLDFEAAVHGRVRLVKEQIREREDQSTQI